MDQITNPQALTLAETAAIVENSEMSMVRALTVNLPHDAATEYGIAFEDVGDGVAIYFEKLPIVVFNRAIGIGVSQPATEPILDELVQSYGRRQLAFGVSVSPAAQPPQLMDWLLERRFQHGFNLAKMIRGNEPPPAVKTDLRIESVTKANASHYAHIVQIVFGMPDWTVPLFELMVTLPNIYSYVAYADDIPAAVGSLYINNSIGALFNGATLPEYRRRGGQGAIMARRITDGITLGCRWFTTETVEDTLEAPNPSHHNMLRTGFQLAYVRPTYVHEPHTAASGLDSRK